MSPRRVVPYVLAAVAVAEAAAGFARGGPLSVAALGFPGAIATFYCLLLARAGALDRELVARLGGPLLYAAGAAIAVAALIGAAGLMARTPTWVALPLAVAGAPLAAVAALRLSTGASEKLPLHGSAVALFLLAGAGTVHLARLWPHVSR